MKFPTPSVAGYAHSEAAQTANTIKTLKTVYNVHQKILTICFIMYFR